MEVVQRFEMIRVTVLKKVVALVTQHIKRINNYYVNLEQNCERLPTNEDEFLNLRRVFTNSDKDVQALMQEIRKIDKLISVA